MRWTDGQSFENGLTCVYEHAERGVCVIAEEFNKNGNPAAAKTTASDSIRVTQLQSKKNQKTRNRQEEERKSSPLTILRERIRLPEDTVSRWLLLMIFGTIAAALIGLWIYNRAHTFDQYRILARAEKNDVEGTLYERLGNSVIKYSHDGIFCVNLSNETQWSAAYDMQTPISDICEGVMVIAEQQGKQVYVLNEKGLLGSFETSMNIRKIQTASNGVTAVVEDDEEVDWIELFSADGSQIASVRASLEDSGFPLDIALSPNGKRLTVSYLTQENGVLTGKLSFYDFSSSSEDRHLMLSLSYPDTIFPDVFYADGMVPVAVGDNCFVVFDSSKKPSEKVKVPIVNEILSCFHDGENIGFIFDSGETDTKYVMDVYNFSGKRTMQTPCSFDYTGVQIADGEIFLYDASNLTIYRTSGRKKLSVNYEREVKYFGPLKGLRRYLVITRDSMDQIRIE